MSFLPWKGIVKWGAATFHEKGKATKRRWALRKKAKHAQFALTRAWFLAHCKGWRGERRANESPWIKENASEASFLFESVDFIDTLKQAPL